MTDGFFVTGTDTNVGKTLLSALLVAALDAMYWKPIQTGASEGTDRQTVMNWAGVAEDRTIPECYVFDPPVSPHLAAELAGVTIELARIHAQLHGRQGAALQAPLIAEGAGGILVPINARESMLDLARALGLPVIVASRSALGTINHTRLTVAALRGAGIPVLGVVMLGPENKENERAVERFAEVPVIGRVPWLDAIHRDALLQVYRTNFDASYFAVEPKTLDGVIPRSAATRNPSFLDGQES